MEQKITLHRFPGAESLARRVSDLVEASAKKAIRERGCFHLVLAGGNTPSLLYRQLESRRPELTHWRLYFGDERCLPRDHQDRNDRMVLDSWPQLSRLEPGQLQRIPAELGAEEGAASYARIVNQVPTFDLVLLGIGEDGHTASLFPGHLIGEEINSPPVLPVRHAPKPPPNRISLSARRLSQTRQVFFLITGKGKRSALSDWMEGIDLPVRYIQPAAGVDIFTDPLTSPGQARTKNL